MRNEVTRHTVSIIGLGNVATHLERALRDKVSTVMINPRTLEGMEEDGDIAIISVKDDVISAVAHKLSGRFRLIAHTSGSVPMEVLQGCAPDIGVFYPLQTFTKGVEMDYSVIPFFIEGNNADAEIALTDLARLISGNVQTADSDTRKTLHLASVFACNFTNRLVGIADRILKTKGLDYTVILPLLQQTMGKLHHLSPTDAQTGPAARGDTKVINAHLSMLEEEPRLKDIYEKLSADIMDEGGHKQVKV